MVSHALVHAQISGMVGALMKRILFAKPSGRLDHWLIITSTILAACGSPDKTLPADSCHSRCRLTDQPVLRRNDPSRLCLLP
jgi:hypothetical protein